MESYSGSDGMARSQSEIDGDSSRCVIYTRQSGNIESDLTSCQVQIDACH